jgi:hypothetical protein
MPNRLSRVLTGIVLLAAIATAPPALADDPPEFHRDPAKGVPGTTIAVSGRGCTLDGKPAQRARVHIARLSGAVGGPMYDNSQSFPVDQNGTWAGTFTVPEEAPPGPYLMSASCQAGDTLWNHIETEFEVLDPSAVTTTTAPLPTPTTQPPPPAVPEPPTTVAPVVGTDVPLESSTSTDTSQASNTMPRDDAPQGSGGTSRPLALLAALAIVAASVGGAVAARRRA